MNTAPKMEQISVRPLAADGNGIKAIFCIRNEKFRLPFFLEYYRKLGVSEFFAVDNDSTDDTQAYLLSQPDVHVFHTSESYKESNAGRVWTSHLADEYCTGCWVLTLDVDEFLVYPYFEVADLRLLTAYLDRWKFEGLYSIFLDFYAKGRLSQAEYTEGSSTFDLCDHFDSASTYSSFSTENFPYVQIKGGIRQRKFWDRRKPRSGPSMRKIVLVKWKEGFSYLHSTHSCSPIKLADITGVLAHFKFMSHLKEFSQSEVERNDRVENSADWKVYANRLSEEDVELFDANYSVKYTDSSTLIEDGHLRPSLQFFDFCARKILEEPKSETIGTFLKNRQQRRDLLAQEERAGRTITYADATKLWGSVSMFNANQGVSKQDSKSLSRLQARMDEVAGSRSWRATYYLRAIGAKTGLSDKRSVTETRFDDQDLYTNFKYIYESIWWDFLALVRIPSKLVRKVWKKVKSA